MAEWKEGPVRDRVRSTELDSSQRKDGEGQLSEEMWNLVEGMGEGTTVEGQKPRSVASEPVTEG